MQNILFIKQNYIVLINKFSRDIESF